MLLSGRASKITIASKNKQWLEQQSTTRSLSARGSRPPPLLHMWPACEHSSHFPKTLFIPAKLASNVLPMQHAFQQTAGPQMEIFPVHSKSAYHCALLKYALIYVSSSFIAFVQSSIASSSFLSYKATQLLNAPPLPRYNRVWYTKLQSHAKQKLQIYGGSRNICRDLSPSCLVWRSFLPQIAAGDELQFCRTLLVTNVTDLLLHRNKLKIGWNWQTSLLLNHMLLLLSTVLGKRGRGREGRWGLCPH